MSDAVMLTLSVWQYSVWTSDDGDIAKVDADLVLIHV
jgi:hypothetical protein